MAGQTVKVKGFDDVMGTLMALPEVILLVQVQQPRDTLYHPEKNNVHNSALKKAQNQ